MEFYFFAVLEEKSKNKVSARLLSSEDSFFGLQMAASSPCPHVAFFSM